MGVPKVEQIALPGGVTGRALDVLEGRAEPVPARDAATVVVLRERRGVPGGMQVYLLRRRASMAFAAGAHVFPGGAVDPRDADRDIAWAGPSPAWWADVLRSDERTARALVCAAVRETFEESGVLLAGPRAGRRGRRHRGVGGGPARADRPGAVLRRVPRPARARAPHRPAAPLVALDHPAGGEPPLRHPVLRRRPARPGSAPGTSAARPTGWPGCGPRTRSAAAERGEITLMPPTRRTLAELADYAEVAKVLAAERTVVTIAPEVVRGEDGVFRLLIPEPAGDGVREGRA